MAFGDLIPNLLFSPISSLSLPLTLIIIHSGFSWKHCCLSPLHVFVYADLPTWKSAVFALHFLHLLYLANSRWFNSNLALIVVPERVVCMIIISSIVLKTLVTSTFRLFSLWPPGGQRMSLTYVLVAQHLWYRKCCSVNASSGCLLLLLLLLLWWQSQRTFLSKGVKY